MSMYANVRFRLGPLELPVLVAKGTTMKSSTAKKNSLNARLTATPPLTVEQFTGSRSTPGNVGVCLSGGGSRACNAGMGQLRALKYLTTPDSESLLGQVKALSTVSGGSWVGVPFLFLNGDVSDDDYLNTYVPDPSDLVRTGGTTAENITKLPPGNIGEFCTKDFRVFDLAGEALRLLLRNTPLSMIWQVLMGRHILEKYGLYTAGDRNLPTSFFTESKSTLKGIRKENPGLKKVSAHIPAKGSSRTDRPWLICNTAMFVHPSEGDSEALSPIQATPAFTGIVASPDAVDNNRKPVGGGGVTSFAFNSQVTEVTDQDVKVVQSRQWSLTDIVGCSSAAFAERLHSRVANRHQMRQHLERTHGDDAVSLGCQFGLDLIEDVPPLMLKRMSGTIRNRVHNRILDRADAASPNDSLVPTYDYWPVRNASAGKPAESRLADGGSLENTGVAAMLAYTDIESIIAFVNSSVGLSQGTRGVIDQDGNEIPGTAVVMDGQIPALFGYAPYSHSSGYTLFPKDSDSLHSRSRVFAPDQFPELLKGLWAASGNQMRPGANTRPAIFSQTLETVENSWFSVDGGREVTVVWSYLNPVSDWQQQLRPEVQVTLRGSRNFPNFDTIEQLQLAVTDVSLLASLTAWCVADPSNSEVFTSLFQDSCER